MRRVRVLLARRPAEVFEAFVIEEMSLQENGSGACKKRARGGQVPILDLEARLKRSRIISWNTYLPHPILHAREAKQLKTAKNIARREAQARREEMESQQREFHCGEGLRARRAKSILSDGLRLN